MLEENSRSSSSSWVLVNAVRTLLLLPACSSSLGVLLRCLTAGSPGDGLRLSPSLTLSLPFSPIKLKLLNFILSFIFELEPCRRRSYHLFLTRCVIRFGKSTTDSHLHTPSRSTETYGCFLIELREC